MATTVSLFLIPIATKSLQETFEILYARAIERKGGSVYFANVHSLVETTRSSALASAMQNSTWNAADGVPLIWLSRALRTPIHGRTCGPDFFEYFLRNSSQLKQQGFIGGKPGQTIAIAKKFGIDAIEYAPPYRIFSAEHAKEDWNHFLSLCPDKIPPAIVWVGLGAPKQELWIDAVKKIAPDVLFFGVGAAFDFLSGNKGRAPKWMQKSGLEWLFRLCSEPRRLGFRYFSTNLRFLFLSVKELVKKYV